MSETETGAAVAAPEGNAASASIPQAVTVVEPARKSIEDTMSETFDRMNPPRDETGRFQGKSKPDSEPAAEPEAQVEETAPEAEAAPTETEGQTPAAEPSEPETPAITHPSSLPAELRDKWKDVPPAIAEWAAKREAESHKRITELGQTAKTSEAIRQIADRYKSAHRNAPPEVAFERLSAAADLLDKDPVGALQWLAQTYNVDLSQFGQAQTQGTETPPEVARLQAQLSQLQRQIADSNSRLSAREQAEQQAQLQSIDQLVADFAKDKPYWAELENDVYAQVHAIRATDANMQPKDVLERAYERASKLNEAVQAKVAADRKAEADKKAKLEAAKKAAEAKKAASVNVRSTVGGSPKSSGSWEDTMRQTADRLMGG